MTLQQIWDSQPVKSDKGNIHSYLPVYEEILAPYRTKAKNILEIGLFNGASLLMWEQYYSGKVHGIDCNETPHDGMADLRPLIAEGTHSIHILNAEDPAAIKKAFKGIKFDVIIEDAGHHVEQQLKLYEVFKPYMKKKSLYVIEDIQDIDGTRSLFENIDPSKKVTILDRREIKSRYDDVIVLIQDK